MAPSSLSKPVFWFAVAAFVFFGVYFSWTALHTRTFNSASITDLQREFSAISEPPSAERSGEVRNSSKITVQAVYANYLAQMTNDEIARYYEARLSANGWKLKSRGDRSKAFCKADIDAVVEFIEATPVGSRYYFGLTREEGPAKKTGC